LDDIKEAVETEVYGKYNRDETRISGSPNNYTDFTLITNPSFPYKLCDDYNSVKNIILDVSENPKSEYYLLYEHHYAHGVWDIPTVDGTKIIFNDLKSMKEYCKSVQEKINYMWMDGEDNEYQLDEQLIDKIFDELPDYKEKNNLYTSSSYTNMLNHCLERDEKTYNNISLEKFKQIQHYQENGFDFTIGNDFFVNFTIYKIKNNTYWK
jgi:hypothetical protein